MRQKGEDTDERKKWSDGSKKRTDEGYGDLRPFCLINRGRGLFKIVIPVGVDTMNFTLQWLFVLLAGLLLGSKRAFYSVTTYLVIGLVGFPVFARGGGPAYLIRPTFGFLLGFAFAAYAMGKVCEILHSSKIRTWILAAAIGYVIYYGTGILYFYFITHFIVVTPNTVGWAAIFAVYCLPTMFPDGLLCILAIMLAARLRPVVSQMLS